jgi:hypothetical protein
MPIFSLPFRVVDCNDECRDAAFAGRDFVTVAGFRGNPLTLLTEDLQGFRLFSRRPRSAPAITQLAERE